MSNLLESTETFNTKELHDLCDNVKYKSKEGRFDRIRQWLNTNKDALMLLVKLYPESIEV